MLGSALEPMDLGENEAEAASDDPVSVSGVVSSGKSPSHIVARRASCPHVTLSLRGVYSSCSASANLVIATGQTCAGGSRGIGSSNADEKIVG
jgi:hypothetical protein